jgi:hypothetical protein
MELCSSLKGIFVMGIIAFLLTFTVPFLGLIISIITLSTGFFTLQDVKRIERISRKPTSGRSFVIAGLMIAGLSALISFITVLTHANFVGVLLIFAIVGAAILYLFSKLRNG